MRVLETERLLLRWFTAADAAFILDLLNQPSWQRFIGDRGIDSLEAARHYIETVPVASYHRHGFGLFAVELKAPQTPAGMCGLIKREGQDDVEIGFAFLPAFERLGLAYEAASAVLAYSADTIGLTRVVGIIKPDNVRSMRLLERLGMRDEGLVRFSDDDDPLRRYAIALRPGERTAGGSPSSPPM